jgi:mRNA interferase MazF
MKPGDIVLVALQQSDGKVKKRPSLLIKKMPGHGDWLICGISTQLHHFINGFDEQLDQNHPDFKVSRLLSPSIIRLGFLTVVSSSAIPGVIGNVSQATIKKLTNNLVRHLNS